MTDALRLVGGAAVLGALVFAATRVDAGAGDAAARAVDASGSASLTETLAGDAILRAGDMRPGERTSGVVTVDNRGDATGAFKLAQVDVLDTPGATGRRLSQTLRLRVEDARSRRRVYSGTLAAMDEQPLGYLRAGEKRTYRFTLALPASAPADAFTGARVESRFDWTASTGEPPARRPRPDSAPPRVVAQIAGARPGTVVVGLTADERSVVTGASAGARPLSRPRLAPGRPALLTVALAPRATLPLQITVADSAGNRTVVTVTSSESRRGDSNP